MMTKNETNNFPNRFPNAAKGHFRTVQDHALSSIGVGTYLGGADSPTDDAYTAAIFKFVESGGNVIDTASNYRYQRSERNIGAALKVLAEQEFPRDELFIATKAGYLAFDGSPVDDVRGYFERQFVRKGLATIDDLVGGGHVIAPKYLQSQIDQSLANLCVETIDLFYVHNPEAQLGSVDKYTFEARLAKAFEVLEENRAAGKLKFYGAATWNGFRVAPDHKSYHSLERMVGIAKQIGGESHGFKFVQLPLNLAMPEACLLKNQAVRGKVYTALDAARELGVAVMCSASILQGKLTHSVPFHVREILGNPTTDAMTGIQFVRSTPGVTTALVGMSGELHVEENMRLASISPIPPKRYAELFSQ